MGEPRPPNGSRAARVVEYLPAVAFIALLGAWSLYRAPLGFYLSDEGLCAAVPMRYAMGDLPLRDEIMTAFRFSGVLMWPVLELWPDISLLQLRWLSLGISALCHVPLFLVYRREASPTLALTALGAGFCLQERLVTASYDTLGVGFIVAGAGLWVLSCQSARARWSLSVLAGICLFLASVSYVPLVVCLAIPAVTGLLFMRSPEAHGARGASAMVVLTGLAGCSLAVVLALALGLAPHLSTAYEALRSVTVYDSSSQAWVSRMAHEGATLLRLLPHLTLSVLVAVGLAQVGRRASLRPWVRLALYAAPLAIFLLCVAASLVSGRLLAAPGQQAHFITIAVVLLTVLGAGPVLAGPRDAEWRSSWRMTRRKLLAFAAVLFLVMGLASASGFSKGVWALPLALSVGLMDVGRAAESDKLKRPWSSVARSLIPVTCLAMACLLMWVRLAAISAICPIEKLDYKVAQGPLRGLTLEKSEGEGLDALREFLAEAAPPGSDLLVYFDGPMVYFVSHTRPALPFVWSTALWTPETERAGIQYMLDGGRQPEIAVKLRRLWQPGGVLRSQTPLEELPHPLDDYVKANYHLERVIGTYEIWRLNEG